MSLFESLIREQSPTDYAKSKDALYFSKHSLRLSSIECFANLAKASCPFDVLRADIVLRSLENKETIEKELLNHLKASKKEEGLPFEEFLENVLSDLPYFEKNGLKNYVPIFPESLALLYSKDVLKLENEPYKRLLKDYSAILIDPFDYYGYALFDSYFTSLIPIRKNKKGMAAYDVDAKRLYFINNEGRLDEEVALFDKKLLRPSFTHLSIRLEKVADAYYSYDKDAFIQALVEQSLVSGTLIQEITKK